MTNFTLLDLLKTLCAIELQIKCNIDRLSMLDKTDSNLQYQIEKLENDLAELQKDASDYGSWIRLIPTKYPFG